MGLMPVSCSGHSYIYGYYRPLTNVQREESENQPARPGQRPKGAQGPVTEGRGLRQAQQHEARDFCRSPAAIQFFSYGNRRTAQVQQERPGEQLLLGAQRPWTESGC